MIAMTIIIILINLFRPGEVKQVGSAQDPGCDLARGQLPYLILAINCKLLKFLYLIKHCDQS